MKMHPKIGGKRRKALPMTLELIGVLEYRRSLFEKQFGRPPRPGEPLFFDPHAHEPRRLPPEARRQALANVLALAGISEHQAAVFIDHA
jgi:hypothetical protein